MIGTAYVVGGGPSLRGFEFSKLTGTFHVAVNRAFEACPEAVVYFLDRRFHLENRGKLAGRRVVQGLVDGAEACHGVERHDLGLVSITNSGYAALRWCIEQGADRVVLLGFDMRPNGHFHDGYPGRAPRACCDHWLAELTAYRPPVPVVNACPGSALECFPKVTLEEALSDAVPA